jgi:glycosyltransferase involved in cell wall biosynthesis
MDKKPSISVFFPAYNDEGTIASMVIKTIAVLKELTDDYEIMVIDDCSPDNSGKIADELARKYKEVKVIHHNQNKGYGGALKSGFNAATKELVFYTDGDAQYDVLEIKKLLPLMTKDVDLVNGYKLNRADLLRRIVLGRMYHYGTKILFNLKVKDVDCDFRLIRKKVFDKVKLKSNSGLICVEMIRKIQDANFKIKQIGVHHYWRAHGKSQFFNVKRIRRTLLNMLKLWWTLVVLKNKDA